MGRREREGVFKYKNRLKKNIFYYLFGIYGHKVLSVLCLQTSYIVVSLCQRDCLIGTFEAK